MATAATAIKKLDFKNRLQLILHLEQPDWRKQFDPYLNLEISKEFIKEEERQHNATTILKKLPVARDPPKKYNFIFEKPPQNHFYYFIRGLYFEYGITMTRPDPIKALETYLTGFEENQDPLCAFKLSYFYSLKRTRLGIKQDLEKATFFLTMSSLLVDVVYAGNSLNIKEQMISVMSKYQQGVGISDILIQKYGGAYFSAEWISIYQSLFDIQFTEYFQQAQDKYAQTIIKLDQQIKTHSDHFAVITLFQLLCQPYPTVADKNIKQIIQTGLTSINKDCYIAALKFIQKQIATLKFYSKDNMIFSNIRTIFYEMAQFIRFFKSQDNDVLELYPLIFEINESLYLKKGILLSQSLHYSFTLRIRSDMLKKGLGVNSDIQRALETTLEELNQPKENENLYAYANYNAAKMKQNLSQTNSQEVNEHYQKSWNQFSNRLSSQTGQKQISDLVYLYYLGRIQKKWKFDILDSNNKFNQALQLYVMEKQKYKNAKTLQYEILCIKIEKKTNSQGKASIFYGSNQNPSMIQFDPIQQSSFPINQSQFINPQLNQQSIYPAYQQQLSNQVSPPQQISQARLYQQQSSQLGSQYSSSALGHQLNNSRVSQEPLQNSNRNNSPNGMNQNNNIPASNSAQQKSIYNNNRQLSAPITGGILNNNNNTNSNGTLLTDPHRDSILRNPPNMNKLLFNSNVSPSQRQGGQQSNLSPRVTDPNQMNNPNDLNNLQEAQGRQLQLEIEHPVNNSQIGKQNQASLPPMKAFTQQNSEILPADSHRSKISDKGNPLTPPQQLQQDFNENLNNQNDQFFHPSNLGASQVANKNRTINNNGLMTSHLSQQLHDLHINDNNNYQNNSNSQNNNSTSTNMSRLIDQSRQNFPIENRMQFKLSEFKKKKAYIDPNNIIVLDLLKIGNRYTTSEGVIIPNNGLLLQQDQQQLVSLDKLSKLRSYKKHMNTFQDEQLILYGEPIIIKQFLIYDPRQLDDLLNFIQQQELKLQNVLADYAFQINSQNSQQNQNHNITSATYKHIIPIRAFSYQPATNESVSLYLIYPAQTSNLYSALRNIPFKQKLLAASQIIDIFQTLHTHNIFHLNIQPNNILFDNKFTPYFSGWELQSVDYVSNDLIYQQQQAQLQARDEDIIAQEQPEEKLQYTLGYTSPEIVNANKQSLLNRNAVNLTTLQINKSTEQFGPKSDVWSLGMILQLLFFQVDSSVNNYVRDKRVYDGFNLVISEYNSGTNYFLDKVKEEIESMVHFTPENRQNLAHIKDTFQRLYFEFDKQKTINGNQVGNLYLGPNVGGFLNNAGGFINNANNLNFQNNNLNSNSLLYQSNINNINSSNFNNGNMISKNGFLTSITNNKNVQQYQNGLIETNNSNTNNISNNQLYQQSKYNQFMSHLVNNNVQDLNSRKISYNQLSSSAINLNNLIGPNIYNSNNNSINNYNQLNNQSLYNSNQQYSTNPLLLNNNNQQNFMNNMQNQLNSTLQSSHINNNINNSNYNHIRSSSNHGNQQQFRSNVNNGIPDLISNRSPLPSYRN